MNNEQKRFTVEKIDRYQDEISDEGKKIIRETIFTAISAIAVLSGVISDISLVQLLTIVNVGILIDNAKGMISAISRKTGLETQVANLEHQVEMDDLEKGRSR